MKKIGLVLFLVGLSGLIGWRLWDGKPASGAAGPGGPGNRGGERKATAVAVETMSVRRGMISDIRTFTGTLQPQAEFVYAPKVGGRLEELPVNIGDAITAGQLIARIDNEEYLQQVNQARASRDVADAAVEQQATELALAEREMDRMKSLRDKKIASEAEWDQAEARHKKQAALHRVAQAQRNEQDSVLKSSEVRLAYTRISAPEDATGGLWFVDSRFVDVGAMLAPNTPIISVVDLSRLTAVVHVIERDFPFIRIGLPVEISTDAYPGKSFSGQVLRIAPVLREASRQARVEIEIKNESLSLRPGMFIRARMEFAHHEDSLLIPRSALVKRDNSSGVFLIDEEKVTARFIQTETGLMEGENIEVLSPALSGRVVTLGHHLLTDGCGVILPDAAPEGPGRETKGEARDLRAKKSVLPAETDKK